MSGRITSGGRKSRLNLQGAKVCKEGDWETTTAPRGKQRHGVSTVPFEDAARTWTTGNVGTLALTDSEAMGLAATLMSLHAMKSGATSLPRTETLTAVAERLNAARNICLQHKTRFEFRDSVDIDVERPVGRPASGETRSYPSIFAAFP